LFAGGRRGSFISDGRLNLFIGDGRSRNFCFSAQNFSDIGHLVLRLGEGDRKFTLATFVLRRGPVGSRQDCISTFFAILFDAEKTMDAMNGEIMEALKGYKRKVR